MQQQLDVLRLTEVENEALQFNPPTARFEELHTLCSRIVVDYQTVQFQFHKDYDGKDLTTWNEDGGKGPWKTPHPLPILQEC